MQKEIHIKDIAEVIAGYTFRTAIQNDDNGDMPVIQARDILENNEVNVEGLPRIDSRDIRSGATLGQNDVLLSCRGTFRAGVLSHDIKNAIASASLYILRIKSDKIAPEYLSIYLNSHRGQKAIQQILSGSTIKTILRRPLEDLPIPLPKLERQQCIIAITKNWQRRKELLNKKINLSKEIVDSAISQLLTQS